MKHPKIAGLRFYSKAFTVGVDARPADTTDEPFVAVGLVQTQFLDTRGQAAAWTEAVSAFHSGAAYGAVDEARVEFADQLGAIADLRGTLTIQRAYVMADGSCQFDGGHPAPPLMTDEADRIQVPSGTPGEFCIDIETPNADEALLGMSMFVQHQEEPITLREWIIAYATKAIGNPDFDGKRPWGYSFPEMDVYKQFVLCDMIEGRTTHYEEDGAVDLDDYDRPAAEALLARAIGMVMSG